ncbi:MAG TPA: glycosyltransferase [Methanothrix sp.]|nr:glycosyltransferase [Methanothrix sp.]HPJ83239.1 glycosyltransferase [Methanothrix sp.]
MRKVLIIGYYFNYTNHIASRRLRGLGKYLPDFGWEPTILTVKNEIPKTEQRLQNINVIDLPYEDKIHLTRRRLGIESNGSIHEYFKTKSKKNKNTVLNMLINFWKEVFAYPDAQKSWYKPALRRCDQLLREEDFEAVISSSGPVTSHLIANYLKTNYGFPWIADLRDLWTQSHYYQYSIPREYIERRLEVNTLCLADALVTVSAPWADKLKELHKGKNCYVITNGYDPEEVATDVPDLSKKFTILYSGELYNGKRDPEPLFAALNELLSTNYINDEDVEIEFFGNLSGGWLEEDVKKYGLESIVKINGIIPREEVTRKQKSAQILLLLTWNHPDESGTYTGKVFEYLAAKRPILSLGVSGSVLEELLSETNAGVHASNQEQTTMYLKNLFDDYLKDKRVKYHGIDAKIEEYSHREMAKKFSTILEDITN